MTNELKPYNRVNWRDKKVEYPRRYKLESVNGQESTYDMTHVYGEIFDNGVPRNEKHMNNMDKQIYDLTNVVLDLIDDNKWLKTNLALTQSFIGKPSDNTFMVTIENKDDLKINRGIFSATDKAVILNEYEEVSE